jgi:hypothetical protein
MLSGTTPENKLLVIHTMVDEEQHISDLSTQKLRTR